MPTRASPACAAAVLASTLLLVPGRAHANCAQPVSYSAVVTGSTVHVTPQDFEGRGCPDADGMLRQDVATGATVRLADFCDPGSVPSPAYVDECVPPGQYRYGYARPYACAPHACVTDRFLETAVTAPLPAGCQRSAGNPGPTTVAPVGWNDANAVICRYHGSSPSWGCSPLPAGSGAVLGADLALLGGALVWTRRRRRGAPRP